MVWSFSYFLMISGTAEEGSRKTIIELLLCYLPFLAYPVNLFYIVLYWLNLSMPSLLISSFPESYRNPFTILVCLTIDMTMLFYYVTLCIYWWLFYPLFHLDDEGSNPGGEGGNPVSISFKLQFTHFTKLSP